jgi:hypothetical protein
LPLAKFSSVDLPEGLSLKARCSNGDHRKEAIDNFLEATIASSHTIDQSLFWGVSTMTAMKDAGRKMDEQDIPLTGRAIFQPGVGVLHDPTYEEALHEVDSIIDPTDRVAELMNDNHHINKSFLHMMRTASKHRAFYIESRLKELHRELLAIVNIEEGD